jgi:hypothetical protein
LARTLSQLTPSSACCLQAKDGTPWDDQVTILHVTKGKEKERWDVGGPVVADLQTATQPYNSLIVELDVSAEGIGIMQEMLA